MSDWKLPLLDCIIKTIDDNSDNVFVTFYSEDLDQEIKTSIPLEKYKDIANIATGNECMLKICIKDEAIKELGLGNSQIIFKAPIKKIPYSAFYIDVFVGTPRTWHQGFLIERWNLKENT